jgi:hypothetical protein
MEVFGNPLRSQHPVRSRSASKPDEVCNLTKIGAEIAFEDRLVVGDSISKRPDVL